MKKIVLTLLCAATVLGMSSCDVMKNPETTTVTEAPADTRPKMPNLVGLTLEQIGMRYPALILDTTYEYSDEYAKDTVMEQAIGAGEKYDEDDKIEIVVSGGSKLIEIDDYTNRNIDDVEQLLMKQGFVCDIIYSEDDKITKNCVIKTVPAAREKAETGTVVICYVSLGAAKVQSVVPDMVGKKIEEATDLATESGIKLTITYEDAEGVEAGTVLEQSVEAETEVEPDTRVIVTIAGENSSSTAKKDISVTLKEGLSGEFQLKYYIDGTLQEEKTEIKELSLTKKINWEVSGTEIHTYTIVVTSLETGKSGNLYEMEVDFTQDEPTMDHHDTFNPNIFTELLGEGESFDTEETVPDVSEEITEEEGDIIE